MGKITVTGIGPGNLQVMTERAKKAIEESEIVVGYHTYIKLIEALIKDKKIIGTAMKQEIERCQKAVEMSREKKVVVISSGDSGDYRDSDCRESNWLADGHSQSLI